MQPRRFPVNLIFVTAVLFTYGCHHVAKAPVAATPPAPVVGPTLPPVQSPSGKTYTRTHIASADDHEPFEIPPVPAGAAPNTDRFNGSARKAAKLSIASGTPKSFDDVGTLLDSLVSDGKMRAMKISKGPDSGRLPQEEKVVTVKGFLYAASRESDNDFHCVVGRDPSQTARYLNVEVSALPPSSSQFFAPIRAARNQFKAFFTTNGNSLPVTGYDKYDPPIAVTITGSLFFDVDHVPPAVGPTGMKPKTAWEIHPVTDFQFEQ